jgi:hypothetical protein
MYLVQTWCNETLITEAYFKRLDDARKLAKKNSGPLSFGWDGITTCRIFIYGKDECEIYQGGKLTRKGTFAQTTIVKV